jgi:hypothetical protein
VFLKLYINDGVDNDPNYNVDPSSESFITEAPSTGPPPSSSPTTETHSSVGITAEAPAADQTIADTQPIITEAPSTGPPPSSSPITETHSSVGITAEAPAADQTIADTQPIITEAPSTGPPPSSSPTTETHSSVGITAEAPAADQTIADTQPIITEAPTTTTRPPFVIQLWNESRTIHDVLADIRKVSHWTEPIPNPNAVGYQFYQEIERHGKKHWVQSTVTNICNDGTVIITFSINGDT